MQINFRNEEGLITEHWKRRTGQEGKMKTLRNKRTDDWDLWCLCSTGCSWSELKCGMAGTARYFLQSCIFHQWPLLKWNKLMLLYTGSKLSSLWPLVFPKDSCLWGTSFFPLQTFPSVSFSSDVPFKINQHRKDIEVFEQSHFHPNKFRQLKATRPGLGVCMTMVSQDHSSYQVGADKYTGVRHALQHVGSLWTI